MQFLEHQYNGSFCEWLLPRRQFIYFNEAGPAPDSAEVESEKPENKPEAPTEPVQEFSKESFGNMTQSFHAKFDEFKKAEASTELANAEEPEHVLKRFEEIQKNYHEQVNGLQANSPVYQEAVQAAQAELDQLTTEMDERLQEQNKKDEADESDETSKELLKEQLNQKYTIITEYVKLFDMAKHDIRLYDETRYDDPQKVKEHLMKWMEDELISPGNKRASSLRQHMQVDEIDEEAAKRDIEAADEWLSQFQEGQDEKGEFISFKGPDIDMMVQDISVQEVLPLNTRQTLARWLKPTLGNSLVTERGEFNQATLKKELINLAEGDPTAISEMASDYGIDGGQLAQSPEGRKKLVDRLIADKAFLSNLRSFHRIENK